MTAAMPDRPWPSATVSAYRSWFSRRAAFSVRGRGGGIDAYFSGQGERTGTIGGRSAYATDTAAAVERMLNDVPHVAQTTSTTWVSGCCGKRNPPLLDAAGQLAYAARHTEER